MTAVVLTAFIFTLTAGSPKNVITMNDRNCLKTGSSAADFIIGMKAETLYRLQDMIDKHFVILAFTDTSAASGKLEQLIGKKISFLKSSGHNIAWFNIKKDHDHALIEEQTSILKMRYRTLFSNIPGSYSFPALPAVLIIDPQGIIQFIYVGYSPVIFNDIQNWINNIKYRN
jgi:hypothetical protein